MNDTLDDLVRTSALDWYRHKEALEQSFDALTRALDKTEQDKAVLWAEIRKLKRCNYGLDKKVERVYWLAAGFCAAATFIVNLLFLWEPWN